MIDTVSFVVNGSTINPYTTYGAVMVSHAVMPPTPKLYRVSLDGMDGSIDMSEWAGPIRFNNRTVTVKLRVLDNTNDEVNTLVNALIGNLVQITFSDEGWHYNGRCDSARTNTRKHVTDIEFAFTCDPYKVANSQSGKSASISGGPINWTLKAARKSIIPTVVINKTTVFTWKGESHSLDAGTYTPSWLVVDSTGDTLGITVSNTTGNVSVKWYDEVL